MKKIYLLLFGLLCMGFASQGQKRAKPVIMPLPNVVFKNNLLRPLATCLKLNPFKDEYTLQTLMYEPGLGFISGPNIYDDMENASVFEAPADASYITRVEVGFYIANSNIPDNLTKPVVFKAYSLNEAGFPDKVLGSVSKTLGDLKEDVDASELTNVIFPDAIKLPTNKKFAIAIDFSALNWVYPSEMDSLSILSWKATEHPNFIVKTVDEDWVPMSFMDPRVLVDLHISPVVSDDPSCLDITPVLLSSFTAQSKGDINEINWTTETEQNNAGFELMRSADGITFTMLAQVASLAPLGNSKTPTRYNFRDEEPFHGMNYYKLIQKDKDGKSSYSKVISVKNTATRPNLSIFPNPVSDVLHINLESEGTQTVVINVMDMAGRSMMTGHHAVRGGQNKLSIPVDQLKPGSYLLKVFLAEGSRVVKFVK